MHTVVRVNKTVIWKPVKVKNFSGYPWYTRIKHMNYFQQYNNYHKSLTRKNLLLSSYVISWSGSHTDNILSFCFVRIFNKHSRFYSQGELLREALMIISSFITTTQIQIQLRMFLSYKWGFHGHAAMSQPYKVIKAILNTIVSLKLYVISIKITWFINECHLAYLSTKTVR